MHRGLALLVGAVLILTSCSAPDPQPADRTVNVGTHSLHAVVSGSGTPVVVFDGGVGAFASEYAQLQERIASVTTVVTYDRAGYGSSEAGPLPRDSYRVASELRVLLEKLGLAGPYVLVGHSLGGLNAEVFASAYPEDLAGVVLLDPPPLGFISGEQYVDLSEMASQMTDEWQATADRGIGSSIEQERAEAEFFQMLASEHREMFAASAEQARSVETFGDVPLVVVASGVPNPMFGDVAGEYQEYWVAESEALAAKSSRGTFIFAESSTHRLHDDASDLVADAILRIVESHRSASR